jgi:16S rRNA (adenine1518-N6/adenine1519-N6)-dimethyltransferase
LPATDAAIAGLPPLREVIAAHGLGARKSLGQHFLLDLNLTGRIAEAAGPIEDATVIEIGPGPGGLTRAILGAGARRVIAIEKDIRCRDALASLVDAARGRLSLIDADAMEVNERDLVRELGAPPRNLRIISNLPYNISTALIIKWLRQIAEYPETYASLVLTVQKEVGDRLSATPRTKAYGRITVMCQWLTECTSCFDITARAFTPPPKVTSSVVRLIPRPAPLAPAAWETMETTTRAAFGQRRKMLRSSLRGIAGPGDGPTLLAKSGIAANLRAEEVDVAGFCALARAYGEISGAGS